MKALITLLVIIGTVAAGVAQVKNTGGAVKNATSPGSSATGLPAAKNTNATAVKPAAALAAVENEAEFSPIPARMAQVMAILSGKQTLRNAASRLNASEAQVKMWVSGFTHRGRAGLLTPSKPSLREFVEQFKGRWHLVSRMGNGLKAPVETEMIFDIYLTPDGTRVQGEVLVLETGRLDSNICRLGQGEKNGDPFMMAALLKYDGGLNEEGGIDWKFSGEIQGSLPLYRKGVLVPETTSHYMKLGESYVAVAPVVVDEKTGNIITNTDFDDIFAEGERMVFRSSRYNTIDTYQRASKEISLVQGVWTPAEYFQMLKSSGLIHEWATLWGHRQMVKPQPQPPQR